MILGVLWLGTGRDEACFLGVTSPPRFESSLSLALEVADGAVLGALASGSSRSRAGCGIGSTTPYPGGAWGVCLEQAMAKAVAETSRCRGRSFVRESSPS